MHAGTERVVGCDAVVLAEISILMLNDADAGRSRSCCPRGVCMCGIDPAMLEMLKEPKLDAKLMA